MEAPQDNTATATDGGAPSSEAATAEHEMLPVTRATRSSKRPRGGDAAAVAEPEEKKSRQPAEADPPEEPKGPKANEFVEDYVEFAANLMLPSPGSGLPSYHSLPTVSALAFLQSPRRRRTVWETWSPLEVSLFEAAIAHHGKDFYAIAKEIRTKATNQVIDFYYVWKKTSHYTKWKKTFMPAHLDVSDEDEPPGSAKEGPSKSL